MRKLLLLAGLSLMSCMSQAQRRVVHYQRADRSLDADLGDARLVRNVEPVSNATSQLLRLRPMRYQIQSPVDPMLLGPFRIGFIAQHLIKVYPAMVRRDYDAAGTLHVDYSQLIPVLTRAIQEQAQQLNTYQGQLEAMNRELVALRAENGRLTVGLAAASVAGGAAPNAQSLQAQVADLQRAVQQLQLTTARLTGGR